MKDVMDQRRFAEMQVETIAESQCVDVYYLLERCRLSGGFFSKLDRCGDLAAKYETCKRIQQVCFNNATGCKRLIHPGCPKRHGIRQGV